jgi:phosphate transport system substrate-binding protein
MNASVCKVATAAALALTIGGAARAEDITYDGATTIGSRVVKELAPSFQAKTGVKLAEIRMNGAGKGLKAAMAGEVSVAGVSRSLSSDELKARPYFQIIGYDALGVFVNEKNPVKSLSKAQLKAIYTGKARNWKEVGGPDLPIVACSEGLQSGRATVETFRNTVLDGGAYGPVKEVDDAADCVKLAASTPGAIGPATMAYAAPGARAIPLDGVKPNPDEVRAGSYLLSRPLLLVAKSRPTGGVKAFFDYVLSADGQLVVKKSFISVR